MACEDGNHAWTWLYDEGSAKVCDDCGASHPDNKRSWYCSCPERCDHCGLWTHFWKWFKDVDGRLQVFCYTCRGD
jgi:hypothetical protein